MMAAGFPRRSSWHAPRRLARQHGVDIDERIFDRNLCVMLRNMALGAEETAWRYSGEKLAVAVHEMRDADHRGLRFPGARSGVARQAFVASDIDLISFDRMRDHRRLFRIVTHFLFQG